MDKKIEARFKPVIPLLKASRITVRYGSFYNNDTRKNAGRNEGKTAVSGVSFDLLPGQWLMVVGPNGAGKSTLLNSLTGTVKAEKESSIRLMGQDITTMKKTQIARLMGMLDQQHDIGYDFYVRDIVALGRYAYRKGMFSGLSEEDRQAIDDALVKTGLTDLEDRRVTTLSGGERQRVFLAQLFAQDPSILLLDEPANHLDLIYQKQIFSLIQEWLDRPGRAVISVVHDLSLARKYGTHALLLDKGSPKAQGPIDHVLTRQNLKDVYNIDVYAWMQELLKTWEE